MAFAHDRRTQAAVFAAVAVLLLGLAWLAVVGSGAVAVPPAAATASFVVVVVLLSAVLGGLFVGAFVRGDAADDEEATVLRTPFRERRGLRR